MRLRWRILIAGAAALLAMLVLYQRQVELEQRAFGGQRISVLVAKSNLRPGTRVREKDVESMLVPELYVHPQAIKTGDVGQILDRPLAQELRQGQPIQWTDFGSSEREKNGGAVPKGLRGTSIPVSEFLGKSSLVSPGDRVDVLATFGNLNELKGSMTVTLLQNVPLIEITGTTAMLALDLEEAEMLTFAATRGTVSLLLRNAEDLDVKKDIPPKSFKALTDRIRELEAITVPASERPRPEVPDLRKLRGRP